MDTLDEALHRYGQNFPAFEKQLEDLERSHPGQYAVVADGDVVGVYPTEQQACAAATGDAVVFKITHQRLRFATLTTT